MVGKCFKYCGPTLIAVAVLSLIIGVPSMASAQVLEIDQSGDVTVHSGPEVISKDGATPIIHPAAAGHPSVHAFDRREIVDAATSAEISPALVEAVAWRESRLRPGLVSPAGAIGEMQLMPKTAKGLGVNPFESRENYNGGATYLRSLLKRYDGDLVRSLAAYNAGPKAVDHYSGVPPFKETQAYVAAILDRLSLNAVPAGR